MSRLALAFLALAVGGAAVGGAVATGVVATDGDGLAPREEVRSGTDPLATDTDGDGLADDDELGGPTDPTAPDTDGDGLADGREATLGADPTATDTDGDGLADGAERDHGTAPAEADTDGDGPADGREVTLGTDPAVADTDGDGLDDGREGAVGSDPTVADTDGDGLADGREAAADTDPLAADADGDGLADDAELARGTDPRVADTDADGTDDGREVRDGTDPTAPPDCLDRSGAVRAPPDGGDLNAHRQCRLGLDPTDPDTDGDGLADAEEVRGRTAAGAPLPDASPTHKDVHLVVALGRGTTLDTDRVRAVFRDARVANPDGTTGIRLHVDRVRLDERVPFNGTEADFEAIGAAHADRLLADRPAGTRLLVVVERTTDDPTLGVAHTPGRLAVVQSGEERAAVHEVAHTIVGHIPASTCADTGQTGGGDGVVGHVCGTEGTVLSRRDVPLDDLRFSTTVRDHLNRTGIDSADPT